jgi:hypothetical protein
MPRNTYLFENKVYKQNKKAAAFIVKGKVLALIKRVKLTQEHVKSRLLKVGPRGLEKLELIIWGPTSTFLTVDPLTP